MQEENLNFCAADETAAQPALDAKGATAEEMSATPLPDDRNKSSRTGDWGAPAAAGAYGGYGASAPYRAQPAERAGTFLPGGLPGTPGAQTLGALQDEVRRLRADARDRDLLADPDQGPVYGALRDKVQQVLRAGEAAGQPIGTDAAYAAVLLRELPALQRQAADSASKQALAALQANSQATPGALGGTAPAAAPDFENMSSSEFAAYHERALRGEWR